MIEAEPTPVAKWIPLAEIPPVGYWIGAQYQGNYRNQLCLDLESLEDICRRAQLPPLVIKSENWNPPTARQPEIVAPGLSAFKKAAFTPPGSVEVGKPEKTVTLESGPNFINDVPIGWQIKIKDRKLLHGFETSHPTAGEAQKQNYFQVQMDQAIRSGLAMTALAEAIFLRIAGDKSIGRNKLITLSFTQCIILLNASTPFLRTAGTIVNKLVSAGTSVSLAQNSFKLFDWVLMRRLRNQAAAFVPEEYLDCLDTSNWANIASNFWRKSAFPDQFHAEAHRHIGTTKTRAALQGAKEFLLASIPGNMLLEPYFRTLFALNAHREPLITIR